VTSFDGPPVWTLPLPAHGIAARSRRGDIGETWWSRRFIDLLESSDVGSRLKRGRGYARSGQVIELDVEAGVVIARVQGSRHTPYRVRIRCKPFSDAQWRRAEKAMAGAALPLASLLAGEMPRDIEELFTSCKLPLFPRSRAELKTSCTCPDWENPCKHIAAAYYILAERFDDDPFEIFAWRGRERAELLEGLRARRGPSKQGVARPTAPCAVDEPALEQRLDDFWTSGARLADLAVSPFADEDPGALLRRLGPSPSLIGDDLAARLAPLYGELAAEAERIALGS
jgi:uncharacterized Zn finger protein